MREKKAQKKLGFSICVYIVHMYTYLYKRTSQEFSSWCWSMVLILKTSRETHLQGSLFKSGYPFFGEGNFPYEFTPKLETVSLCLTYLSNNFRY